MNDPVTPAFFFGLILGVAGSVISVWMSDSGWQSECAKEHNIFTCHQVWVPTEREAE